MDTNETRQKAFELLDTLYASQVPSHWGGKAYLVNRIKLELGVTLKQAEQFRSEWADRKAAEQKGE